MNESNVGHLFGNCVHGRQRRHGECQWDDACVNDAQIGRAVHSKIGRDDT